MENSPTEHTRFKAIRALFAHAATPEERYQVLIDLGKKQPSLSADDKRPENRVHGCQSTTYLTCTEEGGALFFRSESEALISAGLGQLLTLAYSGMTPEEIERTPPTFLTDLGIPTSLSPGRAGGLASMYLRILQEARKRRSR